MKSISFISFAAIISIFIALAYVIFSDAWEVTHASHEEPLNLVNWAGIPCYFGTAMFMFEGNGVALEIYH